MLKISNWIFWAEYPNLMIHDAELFMQELDKFIQKYGNKEENLLLSKLDNIWQP